MEMGGRKDPYDVMSFDKKITMKLFIIITERPHPASHCRSDKAINWLNFTDFQMDHLH